MSGEVNRSRSWAAFGVLAALGLTNLADHFSFANYPVLSIPFGILGVGLLVFSIWRLQGQ